MTVARILHDLDMAGVSIRLTGDRLTLSGASDAVARITPLVREHRAEIIASLTQAIPPHVHKALTRSGYSAPTWTPPACRAFLDQLKIEWPIFRVRSWSGIAVPTSWPGDFVEAVQTIYVHSIQDYAPE